MMADNNKHELISKYYVECDQRTMSEKIKTQLHCCGYDNIIHSDIIESPSQICLGEVYIIPVCGVLVAVRIDIYTIDDTKLLILLWVNVHAADNACEEESTIAGYDKVIDLISMIESYMNTVDGCIQFGFRSNLFKKSDSKS